MDRRYFLISTFCGLTALATVVQAEGDNHDNIPIGKKPAKKKGKKVRVRYTQKKFGLIKTRDLKTAVRGIDEKHDIRVEGFSKEMSRHLFQVSIDPDVQRMLAQVMHSLRTDTTLRQRRLKIASVINSANDGLAAARQKLKEDNRKRSKKVLTTKRIESLKTAKAFLNRWLRSPMEGALTEG